MSNFAINGLMSGVDTGGLVKALMAVEALPQKAIAQKVSSAERETKALQGVNSKVAALQTAAKALRDSDGWGALSGSANKESVSVSVGDGAQAGALNFNVTQLAKSHSEISDVMHWEDGVSVGGATSMAFYDGPTAPPASLIGQVNVANADPRAIAAAVNTAGIGFTAQAIQVGPNQYRLQVTRADGGAGGVFSFNIDTTPPTTSTTLEAGQDAKISFGTGPGAFEVTSTSNTFTQIQPGVDVTVSEVANDVTVTVADDTSDLVKQTEGMVHALNGVLKEVSTVTHFEAVGSQGNGVLIGSTLMRNLSMRLEQAGAGYAGGTAASRAGLELSREGSIEFDSSKFKALIAEDPDAAKAIIDDISARVESIANSYGNSSTGQISQIIKGRQSDIKGFNDQIAAWDLRLERRQETLQRQFTAMETAMSKFQGQASWLSQQIPSMNSNNT